MNECVVVQTIQGALTFHTVSQIPLLLPCSTKSNTGTTATPTFDSKADMRQKHSVGYLHNSSCRLFDDDDDHHHSNHHFVGYLHTVAWSKWE
jgi:hypothetical protein